MVFNFWHWHFIRKNISSQDIREIRYFSASQNSAILSGRKKRILRFFSEEIFSRIKWQSQKLKTIKRTIEIFHKMFQKVKAAFKNEKTSCIF